MPKNILKKHMYLKSTSRPNMSFYSTAQNVPLMHTSLYRCKATDSG